MPTGLTLKSHAALWLTLPGFVEPVGGAGRGLTQAHCCVDEQKAYSAFFPASLDGEEEFGEGRQGPDAWDRHRRIRILLNHMTERGQQFHPPLVGGGFAVAGHLSCKIPI